MMSKKVSCLTTKVAVGDGYNVPFPLMKEERKTQKGSGSVKGRSQIGKGQFRKLFFRCGLIPVD